MLSAYLFNPSHSSVNVSLTPRIKPVTSLLRMVGLEGTPVPFGRAAASIIMWELIEEFCNQDFVPESFEIPGGSETDTEGGGRPRRLVMIHILVLYHPSPSQGNHSHPDTHTHTQTKTRADKHVCMHT